MTPQPTPEWTVQRTLSQCPAAAMTFMRLRMACVGCVMARFVTLAEAAAAYNMEVQILLEKLHESSQQQQSPPPRQHGGGE